MPLFTVVEGSNVCRVEHNENCNCLYHKYSRECMEAWCHNYGVATGFRERIYALFKFKLSKKITVCGVRPGEFCRSTWCRAYNKAGILEFCRK